jgi:glycosyltransferase involved in cell wall biosynthesis
MAVYKKTPTVSIIVPVYNTEKYLEQCLASLREQTYGDIEVIVIDDGSTDHSRDICDRFAAEDIRFCVIHKEENTGLAAVRNDGISAARGKYIMFVDSDDWVNLDFCEKPLRAAEETGSDLVVFGYAESRKGRSTIQRTLSREGVVSKEKALTVCWRETRAYAWNKLYRRELFEGIRYPVGRLFEDDATTHRVLNNAGQCYFLDNCFYNYRILRPGSISSMKTYQAMNDYFHCNFVRIDDLRQWGYDYKQDEIKLAISYLAAFGRKAELSDRCTRALYECKRISAQTATWRKKAMFRLYKCSPLLFDCVSIALGKRIKQQ